MSAVVYAVETISVELSAHSVTIKGAHPSVSKEPIVIVTLPLVVGKELAVILRKLLTKYEAEIGPIPLAKEFTERLGVAPEDWPRTPPLGL